MSSVSDAVKERKATDGSTSHADLSINKCVLRPRGADRPPTLRQAVEGCKRERKTWDEEALRRVEARHSRTTPCLGRTYAWTPKADGRLRKLETDEGLTSPDLWTSAGSDARLWCVSSAQGEVVELIVKGRAWRANLRSTGDRAEEALQQHADHETERQAWRFNLILDTSQQRSRAAGRDGQSLPRAAVTLP